MRRSILIDEFFTIIGINKAKLNERDVIAVFDDQRRA
jgi:hypothetical protein